VREREREKVESANNRRDKKERDGRGSKRFYGDEKDMKEFGGVTKDG
jgi:hypothetical protein